MKPLGVMQMVDTLETGGAERVAVNIANCLPRDRFQSYLCTTRRDGPLEGAVNSDVGRLRLNRRGTLDPKALRKLVRFIRENDVRVLHAHGASIFLAGLATFFAPRVRVIWHDHFGRCATDERPVWLYRLASRRVAGIISVNTLLADWSRDRLLFRADRIWYVPNFVSSRVSDAQPLLPGAPGKRIVCVANFREQKDHLTLLRALGLVIKDVPDAHLLLVGPVTENDCLRAVRTEVSLLGLSDNVSFLGQRTDVPDILKGCDIGVLSSTSEGLPLSLLEYGAAGLAVVATRVGQCAEVLDEGKTGLLVPPSSPSELAQGIRSLLLSPDRRRDLGSALRARVKVAYSADATIRQVCDAYDLILPADSRIGSSQFAEKSPALSRQ